MIFLNGLNSQWMNFSRGTITIGIARSRYMAAAVMTTDRRRMMAVKTRPAATEHWKYDENRESRREISGFFTGILQNYCEIPA